jgi:hypothetical protein
VGEIRFTNPEVSVQASKKIFKMQALKIQETDETPRITLDKEHGIFEISGRSLPEDSAEFYTPVLDWISAYAKAPNATTNFVFRLDYSNTASSKFIHGILMILEKINGSNITWWYLEEDEDMEEAGKEFAEQVSVPFEFKMYN